MSQHNYHISLDALLAQTKHLWIMLDTDYSIKACSQGFCDFFAATHAEILDKQLEAFFENKVSLSMSHATDFCYSQKHMVKLNELALVNRVDEQLHFFDCTLHPLLDFDVPLVLVSFHEVSSYVTKLKDLSARDRLLQCTSQIASFLLTEQEDFSLAVQQVLELLGAAANVDRVYVWNIHQSPNPDKNPELHTTQLYEWSLVVEAQQGNELCVNRPVSEAIPT